MNQKTKSAIMFVVMACLGCALAVYTSFTSEKKAVLSARAALWESLQVRSELAVEMADTAERLLGGEDEAAEELRTAARQLADAEEPMEWAAADQYLMEAAEAMEAAETAEVFSEEESYLELQNRMSDAEETVEAAAASYNSAVSSYNDRIGKLIERYIAKMVGYEPAPYYETSEA